MKKKRKKNPARIVTFLGALVLGVVVGLRQDTYAYACITAGEHGAYYLVTLGAILVGIYAHTILHEAGHLVFGLASGYRFSSFRIFSFVLMQEEGRFVLRRYRIPGTAGQCLMAPPPLRDGKMPVVLYSMGGCMVNALTALVCLLLVGPAPEAGALEWALGIWGFLGLFFALNNAIPRKLKVGSNDGYNTRSLMQDADARRAFWLELEIHHRILHGQDILQMPAEWFAMPEQPQMQNNMIATRAVSCVSRMLAEGKTAEADALMAELICGDNAIAPVDKCMMQMNRLWLEVMGQNRPEVVEQLRTKELKDTMRLLRKFPEVIRMEYALAVLVDHEPEKARKCLARFGTVAHNYAYRLTVEQERKALQAVAEKTLAFLPKENVIG